MILKSNLDNFKIARDLKLYVLLVLKEHGVPKFNWYQIFLLRFWWVFKGSKFFFKCWKICYDKAGNLPNKGSNFNTQTWGKIVYFLFVWLVGIGFRQHFFRVLPNFWDFGAKMSFFHYIINQNRNNFIKHCSPPCTKKPLISEMCIYIKS